MINRLYAKLMALTITVPGGGGGGRATTVLLFFAVAVFLPEGHHVPSIRGTELKL